MSIYDERVSRVDGRVYIFEIKTDISLAVEPNEFDSGAIAELV